MRIFLTVVFFFLLTVTSSFAQSVTQIEMADGLRSSGKIYVVVAVIVLILIALLGYLFTLDRKIKKLEKKN